MATLNNPNMFARQLDSVGRKEHHRPSNSRSQQTRAGERGLGEVMKVMRDRGNGPAIYTAGEGKLPSPQEIPNIDQGPRGVTSYWGRSTQSTWPSTAVSRSSTATTSRIDVAAHRRPDCRVLLRHVSPLVGQRHLPPLPLGSSPPPTPAPWSCKCYAGRPMSHREQGLGCHKMLTKEYPGNLEGLKGGQQDGHDADYATHKRDDKEEVHADTGASGGGDGEVMEGMLLAITKHLSYRPAARHEGDAPGRRGRRDFSPHIVHAPFKLHWPDFGINDVPQPTGRAIPAAGRRHQSRDSEDVQHWTLLIIRVLNARILRVISVLLPLAIGVLGAEQLSMCSDAQFPPRPYQLSPKPVVSSPHDTGLVRERVYRQRDSSCTLPVAIDSSKIIANPILVRHNKPHPGSQYASVFAAPLTLFEGGNGGFNVLAALLARPVDVPKRLTPPSMSLTAKSLCDIWRPKDTPQTPLAGCGCPIINLPPADSQVPIISRTSSSRGFGSRGVAQAGARRDECPRAWRDRADAQRKHLHQIQLPAHAQTQTPCSIYMPRSPKAVYTSSARWEIFQPLGIATTRITELHWLDARDTTVSLPDAETTLTATRTRSALVRLQHACTLTGGEAGQGKSALLVVKNPCRARVSRTC
ncbi:hypothetical protein FIBSPDRAFT_894643 [Athelia psychrophila]|uniref:Uncharacterized protein n=1 Tax=Athelia psychrophila TaxID=1759441 RepID=A0A166FJL9_9AGAM|nr:hypothetical protein FIBSPDRAFT_894643 [Fibularhizoctonia sp. CBS 109695]